MRKTDQNGFTLLEVALAISISSLLLAIAVLSLRIGIKAWEKGGRGAADVLFQRSIAAALSREIGSAYPYVQTDGDRRSYLFKGSDKGLCFVTSSARGSSFGGTALLCYSASERGLALTMRTVPLKDFDSTENGRELELWPDAGASFGYLGKNGWEGSWDADEKKALPLAVKASVSLEGKNTGVELIVPVNAGAAGDEGGVNATEAYDGNGPV